VPTCACISATPESESVPCYRHWGRIAGSYGCGRFRRSGGNVIKASGAASQAAGILRGAKEGWSRVASSTAKVVFKSAAQKPHLTAAEAWLRDNAGRLGWSKKPLSGSPAHLLSLLELIAASIRQKSSRRTRMLVRTVFGKAAGALSVAGVSGTVAAVGVASTGTPIAVLSGAASTSAILYWIGSLAGLGAVAGGMMLTGAGIITALAAGWLGTRKLVGRPRKEADFAPHEKEILGASSALIQAIRAQIASGKAVSPSEMRYVAEEALLPLARTLEMHWDSAALAANGEKPCRSFRQSLAFVHRRNLGKCRVELGRFIVTSIKAHPIL